jgi:hypothetical protein
MTSPIDNHTLSQLISDNASSVDWGSFSPADWTFLLQMAQREGVAPLLYWRFSKSGKIETLTKDARNSLRDMYSSTWVNNQRIFKELEILARLFFQAGIPAVVLKGACFALTIYPEVGLRPMGDLDILVPKAKLAEVVQIAKTLGYEDTLPEASPGFRDLLGHEICLQKTGASPMTLELHHSLVADKSFKYAVPVDWFWSQTELLDGASQARFGNLYMLTPEAQVLYASAHAMLQHGGKNTPLRWFYDLDRLIVTYAGRMDWDLLLSQARAFEWGSALNAALSQIHAYFDSPIPDNVLASLSKHSDQHQGLVTLLQNKPATHVLEERQKMLSLNGYARFRLFFALLIPSPSYMLWRYKLKTTWALPVYYLIRWWGILKDAFQTIASFFQKSRPD